MIDLYKDKWDSIKFELLKDTTQCYGDQYVSSANELIKGYSVKLNRKFPYKKGMIFLFEKEGWNFSLVRNGKKNILLRQGLAGCRVRPLLESIKNNKVRIMEVI